ncbi:MAG TPA: S8 family serine peptidase [Acidimicrobiales bacterium]|nr:S8 family serine peptidase [Acidimicrobiales bacterium]
MARLPIGALMVALLAGLFGPVQTALSATEPPPATSLIVKFVAGLSPEDQQAVIARDGGTETSSIAALRLHVVEVAGEDLDATKARYAADAQVQTVELDRARAAEAVVDDPGYADQWALPKIGWDSVYGSLTPPGSATIAVLDTGVAPVADLAGRLLPGFTAFANTDPQIDPNGHGTSLATIAAAAAGNGVGIAGVGYAGVTVMPVRVLDEKGLGQDSDIIAGVVHAADNGADVILMAFSNPGFSQSLQDAVDYAWSKGAVLVAATGNDGSTSAAYPAGDAKVVGVSATDQNDALWASSNSGPAAFLGAPGVQIGAVLPGGGTSSVTGTSASAAIVAGSAALLAANDPGATNGVVVGRLARTADAAGTAGDTGNGRVNLARAVADVSTEAVVPAGAGATGGPFVGPYVSSAAAISAALQGKHNPANLNDPNCPNNPPTSWIDTSMCGWREIEDFPGRVLLVNTTANLTTKRISISIDHKQNGTPGIERLRNFVSSGTGVSYSNMSLDNTTDIWKYTFDVIIPANTAATAEKAVTFTGQLSAGAHRITGQSLTLGTGQASDLPMGNLGIFKTGAEPGRPDLLLSKLQTVTGGTAAATALSVSPGQEITYTLNYSNKSTALNPASGVQLTDTVPTGLVYVVGSCGSSTICSESTGATGITSLTWTLTGPIAIGGSGSQTFRATVPLTAGFGVGYNNSALIQSSQVDLNEPDNTSNTVIATVSFNRRPVVDTVSISPASAGTADTLTASYTAHDADLDTLTPAYQWFKNGTALAGETGSTLNLATAGNGNRTDSITVRVTVGDANGGSDNKTSAALVIGNTAPVVDTVSISPASAGTADTLTASYTAHDDDGDTLTPAYQWFNGTTLLVGRTSSTLDLGGVGNGNRGDSITVRVTVTDSNGGSDNKTSAALVVGNTDPVVSLTGSSAADEGSTKLYSYTVSDPDDETFTLVSKSCGTNGGAATAGTFDGATGAGSFSCTFPDGPESSTVSVTIKDSTNASDGDSILVTIANVAPAVTLTAEPATANEGQTKTYSYDATDPGVDTLTIVESCGANGTRTDTLAANSFDCTFPDGPATSTVRVSATDGDPAPGNSGADEVLVTIANVAPTGNPGAPYSGPWGAPGITFNGTATDPAGTNDTLTYEWDFDYPTAGSFSPDATIASPTHVYPGPGTFTAALRVSDEDGGADIKTVRVTVEKRAVTLRYTGDDREEYSDVQALTAEVKDGPTFVQGVAVTFTIGTQSTASAPTGTSGIASATLKLDQPKAVTSVVTAIVSNALYTATSVTDTFNVLQETVAISDILPTDITIDGTDGDIDSLTVSFLVDEAQDLSLSYALATRILPVTVSLSPVATGSSYSCSAPFTVVPIDDDTVRVSCTIANVATNVYQVDVAVNNGYFVGSQVSATAVMDPAAGFTTGGGMFLLNPTTKVNFGLNAKVLKSGQVQGSSLAVFHFAEGNYIVKSNSMGALAVSKDASGSFWKATLTGKATYQSPPSRTVVCPTSTTPTNKCGGYSFSVYVEDWAEPGSGKDKYWIEVKDPNNQLVAKVSMPRTGGPATPAVPTTITGGNVQMPH